MNTSARTLPYYSPDCVDQDQPSDAYALDHMLHAMLAKFTGGLSPAALGMAHIDWATHLLASPSKQSQLWQSGLNNALRLTHYAAQAAVGQANTPLVAPDARFASEAWQKWPFNVLSQGFLLQQAWWQQATTGVRGVERHHQNMVTFMAQQWLDAVAPSNFMLSNADVVATTQAQRGANLWQGWLNWCADQQPQSSKFVLGKDVACTAGQVVLRNRLMELIQYTPTTAHVYAEPILITPAWIMKYYILDLSPHNSLVKYLVDKGHTVFMISWRNCNACARDVGFDEYLYAGLGEAIKAVKAITEAPRIHAMGYCLGGTLLSIMAAALARHGDESLKTVSLLAAQVDFAEAGDLRLFIDDSQVSLLDDVMWQQGYLDKPQMAGAFNALRANALVWAPMIAKYWQGVPTSSND